MAKKRIRRVGCEPARVLDLLMGGKSPPAKVRILPEGIVTRRSTDILAMDVVPARSGFSSRRWMSTVFPDATGATPGGFRRRRAVTVHAQAVGEPVA